MPVRLRLSLLFAVVSLTFAVGGGLLLHRQAGRGVLDSAQAVVRAQLTAVQESLTDPQDSDPVPEILRPELTSGAVVQAINPSGRRFGTTEELLDPATTRRARRQALTLTRRLPTGDLLVRAVPVARKDGTWLAVAAAPLNPGREALDRLDRNLLVAAAGEVLLASVGAWLLAGAALRPVERMRRQAAAISAEDSGSRLEVPATRDEVARLAVTFNDVLARIQDALARERRFVADAGHELRTPLAILLTELELAAKPTRSRAELVEAVGAARGEVDRLARLAERLLLLARADGGALVRSRHRQPLAPVLAEAARRCAAPIPVHVEVPAELTADIDEEALTLAVDNLLANATRAAGPDGEVRLRGFATGREVVIEVLDDGPGFEPAFLPEAFSRFSRGDLSRTTASGGAGLGLAIVRAVAEAHGGTAEVANQPRGALARLRLPA